uniref:BSD domain-containing protein n=2 Tax=Setaria italica TaxID=4555 RepID=K3XHF9_SETIT
MQPCRTRTDPSVVASHPSSGLRRPSRSPFSATPLHLPPTSPVLRRPPGSSPHARHDHDLAAMSWLARSIAATLSSAHSDDDESESASGDQSPPRASDPTSADAGESDEQPDTPSRGVKGDISELTESLTRQFWGVASFLAPPPVKSEADERDEQEEAAAAEGPQSPRIDGIRSDLAEIGGRVRTGISMLSNAGAVAEISRIASSLLPFGSGEEEGQEEGEAVGVTEEVVVFVSHISKHPKTWLDFPLFADDRHADDFELSEAQYGHAVAIEHLVPSLSYLRTELCSTIMSEACFWKIYFVLLHSKLNKQDAEILSTPQILEAREELLQSSPTKNNPSSENMSAPSTQPEDSTLSPSSIQNESSMSEAPSVQEPTSDPVPNVEAEKHPISTTDTEVIDKSVIQEELVVKTEVKSLPTEKSNPNLVEDDDEKEVDDWLQDMDPVPSKTGNTAPAGEEEDVSFSDLEDD